tara:strand:+ start:7161 stop:8405 length:1245 start_codon:yes stop_codon:yes gene_type:complete
LDNNYQEFLKESVTKEEKSPVNTEPKNKPTLKTIGFHLLLFVLTFASVSVVSTFLVGRDIQTFMLGGIPIPYPSGGDLLTGALFAALLLSFLTFHEFGHYFAAVYHKVRVTLPYYIPMPVGIGTLGAVIRIKEQIHDTRKLFDIGVAGPLAGFVVSLIVLLIGFSNLPPAEFLNNFGDHSSVVNFYNANGHYPDEPFLEEGLTAFLFGKTPLYSFLSSFFDAAPPMWEIMHYPFLLAGWFGLFFTALNLMPVGQLDGGHILYSLIGYKKHKIVARLFFTFITILAGIEAVPMIYNWVSDFDHPFGMLSWLIWAAVLILIMSKAFNRDQYWISALFPLSLISSAVYLYVIKSGVNSDSSAIWLFWTFFIAFIVKVEHPPVLIEKPLTPTRKVLGWLSMIIFVLSISLNPLSIITP